MAQYKIAYPGLNESLKHLRVQVIDSLPYAVKNLPRFSTPEEVFNYCKSNYTYKSDPAGCELFMTVPTLLTNNPNGGPGLGDCDDATIFCLTMLLISGFDCGIVLVGRSKNAPTHIYAYSVDKDEKNLLDLTNKQYNQIRPYPFKQYIPFKISKEQLNMFLQLSDNSGLSARRGNPKRFFNKITAEKNRNLKNLNKVTDKNKLIHFATTQKNRHLKNLNKATDKNKLIHFATTEKNRNYNKGKNFVKKQLTQAEKQAGYFLGSKDVFLPANALDALNIQQAKVTLLSEGYDLTQLSEYLSSRADRKARRAEKFKAKMEKRSAKTENIRARAEKKRAKAEKRRSEGEAKKTRAEAKRLKAEKGGGNGMERFFKGAKGLFPGGGEEENPEEENPDTEEGNYTDVTDQENPDQENPDQENQETELEEGFAELNKTDYLGLGLFAVGLFLEKTKRV